MPRHVSNNNDHQVMLDLLRAVQHNEALTQRSIAQDLGIALGLVNSYLKRCISKGLIKVRQAPNKRYAYYLTPKGFAEKTRLTAEFLSQSLSLFRQAHHDYGNLLEKCMRCGYRRIALSGVGDLADIVRLLAREKQLEIIAIIDSDGHGDNPDGSKVVDYTDPIFAVADAIILTALQDPQKRYDDLVRRFPVDRVLVPDLLDLVLAVSESNEAS